MWRFLRNRRLLLCLHTIFRALIYWAHRAVVLAIAWHLVSPSYCTQYHRHDTSSGCLSVCSWQSVLVKRYIPQQSVWKSEWRFYIFKPPTVYTNPILSNSPHLEPWALVPSGEYIKNMNRQNFHVWNSYLQYAARLLQTTSYDRLILSNSWATCLHIVQW